ncbi:MAG: hypothetical protein ACRC6V_01575 [Bacteroidales bacterium]
MWTFKKKTRLVDVYEVVPEPVVPESVMPPESVIDAILADSISNCTYGMIARQWVNWGAEELGMPGKYHMGHPITVQSFWVLYEACRRHKEKENEGQ